jgi:TRAP-type mannitol/chloroaromatic compound transport system permease small subunit
MAFWLRIASHIDRTNEWIGRAVYWLTLVMVLIGSYNALVRYIDRFIGLGLSSNTYIELQWYMFSLIFLLGAAYTLKHDSHVRVDVLISRLSPRGRAWINLLGTLLFLIPFCVLILWTSWPIVRNSWIVLETSSDPGGLPRYPIRTAIPVAFLLLMFQGVSVAIKQIAFLRGHLQAEPNQLDTDADAMPAEGI